MDLTKRHLEVLLAVKLAPEGLRAKAYEPVMPELVEAGLVEERPKPNQVKRDETALFLTAAGREALAEAGDVEPKTADRD